LNHSYEKYQERVLKRDPKALVKRQKEGAQAFEEWYGVEWEKRTKGLNNSNEDSDDDDDDEGKPNNGNDSDSSWGDDMSDEDDSDSDWNVDVTGSKPKESYNSKPAKRQIDEKDGTLSSLVLSKKAKVFFDNPLFNGVSEDTLFSKEMGLEDIMDEDDENEAIKKASKEAQKKRKESKKARKSRNNDGSDSDDDKKNKGGFEIVKSNDPALDGTASSATCTVYFIFFY
jgi:AdoMet-dependent rRNA methyltransferase SPB1